MTKPRLSHPPRSSVVSSPAHLNQVNVNSHLKGETRPFPRCIHFSHIEVFDIPRVGSSMPVNKMSKASRRASSDRPHGTSLDTVEECYRALRRAVELSEELALGTDVVVAACPKSPRSKVCKVRPEAWLIDTGSGHDLVDFALVLDSAQLIEPANSNILLHTANGECRPNGSITMDIKPLNETSSVLVLGNPPNVLRVGLRCMEYGYSFHWPRGQVPYLVTPGGFQVDCAVENNVPIQPTTHEFPNGFAVPAPKTRLEEALSRSNTLLASGCDAPARGEGPDDTASGGYAPASGPDDPAGGGYAPASGISEPDAAVVDPGADNTAGLDIDDYSSGDEIEPDPRRDLRAEAVSTKHLLIHQPKNRYCNACTHCKVQRTPCRRGA